MQDIPFISIAPPLILLASLCYSVYVWMLDPGLATLAPEYLQEPLYPQQALRVYCRRCKIVRLPGVQHCHHCGVCIRDYDHHCGIVGKCSGLHSSDAITIWGAIVGLYWGSMAVCAVGIGYTLLVDYLAKKYLPQQ